jgi:hypothetical protein
MRRARLAITGVERFTILRTSTRQGELSFPPSIALDVLGLEAACCSSSIASRISEIAVATLSRIRTE